MLPVMGATFGGIALKVLSVFFITKTASIISGLGIALLAYSSLPNFLNPLTSGIQSAISSAGAINFEGHTINAVGYLGAAGLWDALNIIISGYVAVAAIKSAKMFIGKKS